MIILLILISLKRVTYEGVVNIFLDIAKEFRVGVRVS